VSINLVILSGMFESAEDIRGEVMLAPVVGRFYPLLSGLDGDVDILEPVVAVPHFQNFFKAF